MSVPDWAVNLYALHSMEFRLSGIDACGEAVYHVVCCNCRIVLSGSVRGLLIDDVAYQERVIKRFAGHHCHKLDWTGG